MKENKIKLLIETQGLSEDFQPNGSYEAIVRGEFTLEEFLPFLSLLPDVYPEKVKRMEDFCPIHVLIKKKSGKYLSIFLNDDHSFSVIKYPERKLLWDWVRET